MEKAQQWARVRELFGSALEIESSHRTAFLLAACGDDEALRAEVESLLAAHETPDFLSDNAWHEAFSMELGAPRSIGPFQLVRKLGEGGMGQVWLADQTSPVRRQVAVKFLRSGLVDAALLQRFLTERQSLAIMDHPAIAKVFEAGSTADGQPYLVMEYVPGQPITNYCDDHKLNVRERLELLIKVCEGVQHAHQKAIIHRDLKPSNILVTDVDGVPQPRIIDFGLAKGSAPGTSDRTIVLTQAGGFIGTPGYMSPEQAEAGFKDIDTRTDVYSLGAVLYVLLTGQLPFETRDKPMTEVLRQLREDDPSRPSVKVKEGTDTSSSAAALRSTEPGQLVHLLHGDLDWIVLKTLEKDRNRRYGTPAELAADLRNYLRDEPVIARPASTGYRLRKYVRRHRLAVSVACGLIILLAVFASGQAAQLRRITRERDRADRVTAFMSGMFKISSPSEARGNSVTAREILDKASADIDKNLTQDPELQAQMMMVMGNVYSSLGLYKRAEVLLRRVSEVRQNLFGPDDPQTLNSIDALAWVVARQGHYAEAEKLQRETLATGRRKLGAESRDVVRYMVHLADTLGFQGHYAEAEPLYRQALEINRRTLGSENPDTLASMHSLSTTLDGEGKLAEAEGLQKQVVVVRTRTLGPEHPDTLLAINALAWTLGAEGRYDEAEKLQRESLDIRRKVLGADHPLTLKSASNLAITYSALKRYPEAEALQRNILEVQKRVLGAEHPDTLGTTNTLAWTLDMEGRFAEAEKMQRELLNTQLRTVGPENPQTLKTMDNLAGSLQQQGHFTEAEKLERNTYEIRRRVLGPENASTAITLYNLACVEARAGKREEAINLLAQAVDHGLAGEQDRGMSQDPDLKSLLSDPRFQALAEHAKAKAELAAKAN